MATFFEDMTSEEIDVLTPFQIVKLAGGKSYEEVTAGDEPTD